VCGVYALYDGGKCVFVGTGDDAVGQIRGVYEELGSAPGVSLKIEEHSPDSRGVLSLLFGSWLDEASPDGARRGAD